jgi:hypothetical protein
MFFLVLVYHAWFLGSMVQFEVVIFISLIIEGTVFVSLVAANVLKTFSFAVIL